MKYRRLNFRSEASQEHRKLFYNSIAANVGSLKEIVQLIQMIVFKIWFYSTENNEDQIGLENEMKMLPVRSNYELLIAISSHMPGFNLRAVLGRFVAEKWLWCRYLFLNLFNDKNYNFACGSVWV
jgi:hypothetical protein